MISFYKIIISNTFMKYIRCCYNAYIVFHFDWPIITLRKIRYSLISSRVKATHYEDKRDVVLTYLKQKRKRFG